MTLTNNSMPRDAHDAPIPVLPPRVPHSFTVATSTANAAIALDKDTRALYISADSLVYYAFGDAAVTVDDADFQRAFDDYRVIGVPSNATHIRFYGGSEDANVYMEEM